MNKYTVNTTCAKTILGPPDILCVSGEKTVFSLFNISRFSYTFLSPFSLAELNEHQLEIVNTPYIIEQMVSAMLCPSFNIYGVQIIIGTFLALSYSCDTHVQLTRAPIIRGVLEASKNYLQDSNIQILEKRILM